MTVIRSIVFKCIISILCSFYIIKWLDTKIHFYSLHLLLSGLVLCTLLYHFFDFFIKKFSDQLTDKRLALASVGIAGLLMIAFPNDINPFKEPENFSLIRITALGERNDSSHSNEVWVTRISNAEVNYKLNTFLPQNGWEEKNNNIVSYKEQPTTLTIKIENPSNAQIDFLMHDWSGKVRIEDNDKIFIVDLYKAKAETYTYNLGPAIPYSQRIAKLEKLILSVITFLVLALLVYLCMLFAKRKNNYFLLSIPLCLLVFFSPYYLDLSITNKFLLLALSIGSCFIMRRTGNYQHISTYTNSTAFFLAAILYAGFAFIGHKLFFTGYPVTNIRGKAGFFILFCCWFTFIVLLFLYITFFCKTRIATISNKDNTLSSGYSPLKLYAIFSGILLACWSFYLIAFYPGIMSADSLGQYSQASGVDGLNDAHPVAHTLLIRLIITIWKSPAMVALTQMIIMSAICSSFLIYLHKAGIPLKWLILFCIILAIVPANGILLVTLWKDVLFCCFVLWLTLILSELVTDTYIFNYRTTLICLALGLVAVALTRHNGLYASLLIAVFLVVWGLKERKRSILIPVAVFLFTVVSYKKILLPILKPVPLQSGFALAAPVHGLATVKYYGGTLNPETNQLMKKLLPDSTWKNFYSPYTPDRYLFETGGQFIPILSATPGSSVLRMYGSAFIHNPYLITRERLCSSEILWNVFKADSSFNFTHHMGIDFNLLGLEQKKNDLTPVLTNYLDFSVKEAEPVLWRPGIYNILIFFLLLSLLKLRKKYLFIFLPLIGTNLSLILAMGHQSFRYVYYIPLVFGFIWLLAISKIIIPASHKKTPTNIS